MQSDLDTKGTYPGQDAEGGIKFARGGESLLLRAATGDETGLKYLAGEKDCLMVKSGEGYCKDSCSELSVLGGKPTPEVLSCPFVSDCWRGCK